MPSPTVDQELSQWLEVATFETPSEQFAQWRQGIAALASALTPELSFGLVAAAYEQVADEARDWMTDVIKATDPTFTGRKDKLLSILAGAAAIEVLESENHATRTLVLLLVESAGYTFSTPVVPAVEGVAHRVGNEIRRQVRNRNLSLDNLQAEIAQQLKEAGSVNPEPPGLAEIASAVAAHDTALKAVTQRLAEAIERMSAVIELQDEELDTLWWSFGGLSQTIGQPWKAITPDAKRAVVAAVELSGLLTQVPAPPSTRGLLTRALGESASTKTSIGDIAEALTAFLGDLQKLPDHRLTPLTSASRQLKKIGGEDATWKTVVSRTLGYNPDSTALLLDAAEQVVRELDLQELC